MVGSKNSHVLRWALILEVEGQKGRGHTEHGRSRWKKNVEEAGGRRMWKKQVEEDCMRVDFSKENEFC